MHVLKKTSELFISNIFMTSLSMSQGLWTWCKMCTHLFFVNISAFPCNQGITLACAKSALFILMRAVFHFPTSMLECIYVCSKFCVFFKDVYAYRMWDTEIYLRRNLKVARELLSVQNDGKRIRTKNLTQ